MRLLPDALQITSGAVMVDGQDLFELPESRMQSVRGRRVAMIFQNAMSALNPVQSAGEQVAETLRLHTPLRGADLRSRQWFAAGDNVRLVAAGSGWRINGEGQALAAGVEGQSVRVRTESGRVVSGVPVAERLVEVAL